MRTRARFFLSSFPLSGFRFPLFFLVFLSALRFPLSGLADTPIKNLTVSGTSQIASGTFTLAAGATLNVSAGTVTFADNQIAWAKVNKSGALLSDLGGSVTAGQLSSGVNAQTGTFYTALDSDRGKLVTLTNASAVGVTLPQAGASSSFIAGWFAYFENRGAGLVTITPTTSTIDGVANVSLTQNSAVIVFSDGTNYLTMRGKANLPAVTLAAHNFANAIAADGTMTGAQPAAGDVSGLAQSATTDTTNAANISSGLLPLARLSSTVNAQTGTSYTVVDGDRGKLVTLANASAVAVTLPQAGASSSFISGWFAYFENRGAGLVTITPATSTIDGAATLTLIQNSSVRVFSDGTNYFTMRGKTNLPAVTLSAHNFATAIAADGTLSGAPLATSDMPTQIVRSTGVITNGANDNVAIAVGTVVMMTYSGPTAAYSVSGFNNAGDAHELYINFNIPQTLTIKHDSGSTSGQRITTPSQADITFAANKLVRCHFVYDQSIGGGVGYWVLFSAIYPNDPSTLSFATTAISASAIDWSTSQSFSKTLSANTTFTFSNQVDGQTIVVALTNTASNYTVTWPTVSWSGGTAPVQTTGAKTDVYTFIKIGSMIYGSAVQNF